MERIKTMFGANAHEILPGLWLGNRAASQDVDWLRSKGIETVFNATKDAPFAPIVKHPYRIPVDDNLEPVEIANMRRWAPEAVFKILREHKAGRPLLVHCHAGMQRSAALVAMTLIANKDYDAEKAMKFVRDRRAVAFFPAANFKEAIHGFESDFRSARGTPVLF
jgi:protein-tyrosine phosphatase